MAPTPTVGVVKPIVSPGITGYGPGPQVSRGPDVTGNAPYAIPKPTPAVPMAKPQAVPTPTIGVVKPIPQPSFTGYGRVPSVEKRPDGKRPDGSGKRVYAVPEPTVAPTPTVAPKPTPAVPMAKPQAVPTPITNPTQPSPAGALPGGSKSPERPRAVLKPVAVPEVSGLLAADIASRRRGMALSYQVPIGLIDANVRGGITTQSRASLADGRPLPDGLTYDPADHTFTIKDTNEVPLPIDVRLTMPTRTGGQGSFVLTIGSP
jgi:hypothetical protein